MVTIDVTYFCRYNLNRYEIWIFIAKKLMLHRMAWKHSCCKIPFRFMMETKQGWNNAPWIYHAEAKEFLFNTDPY